MKKYLNLYLILNALLIVCISIGDMLYIMNGSLGIKTVTSCMFVLMGLVNFCYLTRSENKNIKFGLLLMIGLIFAMLGDVFLELYFITGAILFAVGHVFFFVAYCTVLKFKWVDLIYGALMFVPATLFILFSPIFSFTGIVMPTLCIFYALIISCMTGKAISNFVRKRTWFNLVVMLGSFLFLFSDFMLLLNMFASFPRIVGILCLATYYPAEILLAISICKAEKY